LIDQVDMQKILIHTLKIELVVLIMKVLKLGVNGFELSDCILTPSAKLRFNCNEFLEHVKEG